VRVRVRVHVRVSAPRLQHAETGECGRQALWTFIVVAGTELSTIKATWDHAIEDGAKACKKDINSKGCVTANDIITNVVLSGFFFYLYNELGACVISSLSSSDTRAHTHIRAHARAHTQKHTRRACRQGERR
jgi:hypothetical protein